METGGAEKMSLAAGTGHPPGNVTSIPEFGVNILQVPLEAMALQSFPQLHSALDAGERKYGGVTMEIVRVKPKAPKPNRYAQTANTRPSAGLFPAVFYISLVCCFNLCVFWRSHLLKSHDSAYCQILITLPF